ncbi:2-aminoadipate transaminase-like [Venturia canescens]|uniref:2-aminoadipate transaminase-like n=1 Tax=Venturia canescens TaxID=32260 RepID=UPI001C9BC004|nr:2-aminoadipate transaminase-like [Venturia canescens]XP_043278226.1 2-aminoadipate transaminase-like [Venturia canescens]
MEQIHDPYLRHLFDGSGLFNVYDNKVINLSVGAPGPDLLKNCSNMFMKATTHRMNEEEKEGKYYLFQYGTTAGLWECRDELSKFLTKRYGDPVARENLILTCGATHGLQLLLTSIIAPDGIIFVEEVTYMIALDAFKQFPLMKIIPVPMKSDLVDLDALEKLINKEKEKAYLLNEDKIFWAMFYAIPTYHNPTGMTLPPENCQRLVKIARKSNIVVVCDDVYNLLHYGGGKPPHRLFFYDQPSDPGYKGGNVISNGSFSKILSPAIRFGWLESGPRVTNVLKSSGIMKSGGGANQYVSGLIASLLHLNIEDKFLDLLIKTYEERLAVVFEVLDRLLPSCCSYRKPNGGYFVWIHLPKGCDGGKFVAWCQEEFKVTAIPGARFSLVGESKNKLRLSIAFHEATTLRTAVENLCKGLSKYT